MYDVMIDLETFGTASNAIIVQIAAVPFEPWSGGRVLVNKSFNCYVDPDTCFGGAYDGATILWWMTQDDDARQKLVQGIKNNGIPLMEVLASFHDWPEQHGFSWSSVSGVWCHGLSFDVPILDTAVRYFGHKLPWAYNKGRDTRTVYSLLGDPPKIDAGGVRHDALGDCIQQVSELQAVLGRLQR